ncbi:MAG: DUF5591 domain-containing protein [Gemmatimonadetes bacterium]|jgi:hypothetical protein|nr:DUF5591 domain-containing protein [Gemmatimonadota bacterium]MBT6144881.1 DUF5591 domain-containing protein [Gemmatimonadota bacterium]MBT7861301.1 DUF5591 domain-containing protein [Gemmatimonadota bacterium]
MPNAEDRHLLTTTLLQADAPLSAKELARECGLSAAATRAALEDLVGEGLVVGGELVPGAGQSFGWAARWRDEADRRARGPRQEFLERMKALEADIGDDFELTGTATAAFHDYITDPYEPPPGKRWLVMVQCSVRRPFTSSPSHASIRRAIATATGWDPGTEMIRCPVHVVVLASRIGPVPYDLQDVYPANVRSIGVKEFGDDRYTSSRPILARRMADYLRIHGPRYDQIAAFGEGRYGQILRDAAEMAAANIPVLPVNGGPRLTRVGRSTPRKYWEKHWIQLYHLIHDWLDAEGKSAADERLAALDVEVIE